MLPGRSGGPGRSDCVGRSGHRARPRWSPRTGVTGALVAATAIALTLSACGNAKNHSTGGSNAAPGVTKTSITVGAIANLTGPLNSDFEPVTAGVKAYFSFINAQGGVDGRKLILPTGNIKDDQGSQTIDVTDAQELVQQDHVFAVVGVGTPFFAGARYLASTGTPTFGYQVSTDWEDGPSIFGAYGSDLDYATAEPGDAWIANQLGATSVGILAYGVAQSSAACQAAQNGFQKYGIHVGFSDLAFPYGGDPDTDVLHMKAAGVNLMFSCMDASGNIAFARAIQQNNLSMKEVWLNGYDRPTLQQYSSLMQGVYVSLQHVPFEAATAFPGQYTAISLYIDAMNHYDPADTYDEVALDGWVAAIQFVEGLQQVGKGKLTQKTLVAAINSETAFTGNGLTTPVNWSTAHTMSPPPWCSANVMVQGSTFVPALVQPGNEVFVCFNGSSDTPIAPPAGTPGLPAAGTTGGT
jgi:branched-chain amino acid transport system substrate-binding protein